eukprot:scaffold15163_cov166-Amphora_coffeaeformis.AAC.5
MKDRSTLARTGSSSRLALPLPPSFVAMPLVWYAIDKASHIDSRHNTTLLLRNAKTTCVGTVQKYDGRHTAWAAYYMVPNVRRWTLVTDTFSNENKRERGKRRRETLPRQKEEEPKGRI